MIRAERERAFAALERADERVERARLAVCRAASALVRASMQARASALERLGRAVAAEEAATARRNELVLAFRERARAPARAG